MSPFLFLGLVGAGGGLFSLLKMTRPRPPRAEKSIESTESMPSRTEKSKEMTRFRPSRTEKWKKSRQLCLNAQIIPGLPDELALKVLQCATACDSSDPATAWSSSAAAARSLPLANMALVCRSWRDFVRATEAHGEVLAEARRRDVALHQKRVEDWQRVKQRMNTLLVYLLHLAVPVLPPSLKALCSQWFGARPTSRTVKERRRRKQSPLLQDLRVMIDGCLLFLVEETPHTLLFCPHPPFLPNKCVKWVVR